MGALLATPVGAAMADDAGEIVVEAGVPVPVPVEIVVERLRTELPGVTVTASAPVASDRPARTGGTVTLGLSPDGRLLVVYREAGGRETTRIVADTGDPQAMAAAVAMIVANLHQSQVDSVLATLPPPPAPPPPPVVEEPPPDPPPPPTVRPHRRPALRLRSAAPVRARDGWLSVGWAPFVSFIADSWPVLGMNVGADASLGAWRFEAALGYSPGMKTREQYGSDSEVRYVEVNYSQTLGTLFARRILLDGNGTRLGIGAGLGFLIEAYAYEDVEPAVVLSLDGPDEAHSPDYTPGSSSYLEAIFAGSLSLDVRVIWRELWWSSRIDLAVTTASSGGDWYRPVSAPAWLQISTGVRVTL